MRTDRGGFGRPSWCSFRDAGGVGAEAPTRSLGGLLDRHADPADLAGGPGDRRVAGRVDLGSDLGTLGAGRVRSGLDRIRPAGDDLQQRRPQRSAASDREQHRVRPRDRDREGLLVGRGRDHAALGHAVLGAVDLHRGHEGPRGLRAGVRGEGLHEGLHALTGVRIRHGIEPSCGP